MDKDAREALEQTIATNAQGGDYEAAVTAALQGYGPEILGFLRAVTKDEDIASEVFAQFCEHLWKGLPAFAWQSSFRTWAYTLARNAHHRHLRDPHRRRGQPLKTGQLSKLVDAVRSRTRPYIRTEIKDRFAQLRESLGPDDQTLLILRVDRRMSWKDIARVIADPDGALAPKELTAQAARLRKRFERVKERLREQAEQEGLLDPS